MQLPQLTPCLEMFLASCGVKARRVSRCLGCLDGHCNPGLVRGRCSIPRLTDLFPAACPGGIGHADFGGVSDKVNHYPYYYRT